MSKRGGESTRIRATKVKKRRGVGSRTITVLESDDEDTLLTAMDEYARVRKRRVGQSGKAEGFAVTSVPVFETERVDSHAPPEMNRPSFVEIVTEDTVPVVPARRRKKANDSVSRPQLSKLLRITKSPSDQDALLA